MESLSGSIVVAVVAVLAFGLGVALRRRHLRRRAAGEARSPLAPLAEGLGLEAKGTGAAGTVDGHFVNISLVDRRNARGRVVPFTVVRVETGVSDLVLAREQREPGALADVATGDHAFDQRVLVEADPPRAAALLDAATRSLLVGLVEDAFHREGRWDWATEGVVTDAAHVRRQIDGMVTVTRRWRALDTPAALLDLALHDPVDRVRARAAERLVTWWEHNPMDLTEDAAALLASSALYAGPAVRLARLRGPDGAEILRARALEGGEYAIEAALGLAALRAPEAEEMLLAHLGTHDSRVIAALGEVGGARAAAALEALRRESAVWGGHPEPILRALEHVRARLPPPPPA